MSHASSPPRQSVDTVFLGRVLTLNPRRDVLPDGAVAVTGSAIAAVGPREDVLRSYRGRQTVGGPRAIVLPGMIDTHTHCTQCFVRALTANELPMIPRIYVPAQRSLSPAQAHATVRLLAAQLIRAGVTTLCDGTLIAEHESPTLEALEEVGIRACVARGGPDQDFYHAALYRQLTERSSVTPRPGEAEAELRRTAAFLDRYPARGDGVIRGAVNVSALASFSEGYFRLAAALARERGATLQVHVARDREEVELALSVWGRRPIERLADLGVIDPHLVAVHAVLATGGEIDLLARGGAALTHSPMECVYNLNAIPDVQRFRNAGVRVGLGCDNQGNDMLATMRATLLVQGAVYGIPRYEPDYLTADDVLDMATIEAARVLRWDDRIGSLEAGKAADVTVLDGDAPHLFPTQDLVTELVRFATRAEVTHVMVNGRLLLDNGRHTTVDLDKLRAEADAGAAHVHTVVAGRRYRPIR
ncbi:MAG TPA: amidohydrolase family protein [Candidatus Bathyarchaeia archaeon]|nr:amidohydrolase family protein [Candidatus Bathyarchaeia archaeon]